MHTDRLMTHVLPILTSRRNDLLSLLNRHGGNAAHTVLRNDETMRQLAGLCYGALPFPVRMVVREDAFAGFVLQYRDQVIDALLAAPPAGAPGRVA